MLKPRGELVLIKPDVEDRQRPSGIYVPEVVDEKLPETGIIVATGPGELSAADVVAEISAEERARRRRESLGGLEVGDRVLFPRYAGTEVTTDGVKALLVKASDVLALIEADEVAAA